MARRVREIVIGTLVVLALLTLVSQIEVGPFGLPQPNQDQQTG